MARHTSPHVAPPPSRLTALVALMAMLTSGCLGHLYEVPRSELERLVQTPAHERGQSVFAIQQFDTADEPESAPPWAAPEGEPPPGYSVHGYSHFWVPNIYANYGAPTYSAPMAPSPSLPNAGGVHDASPVGAKGSSSGIKSSGGGGGGNIGNVDKLIVAAIVVGIVVGVALAASEGARYEGTLAVHPHHPVHLWSGNSQRTIALDELNAEDLKDVNHATLVGSEGAGMWLRQSAPLNRKGFSYQFGVGNDSLSIPGRQVLHSPGFRFALGYYPTRKFGLLTDLRVQTYDDQVDSYYNVRLGLEAQWYPLELWRLHLGPFVGAGQTWSATAGRSLAATGGERPYVSFGALAELELTTRLGLIARWHEEWLPTAGPTTRPLSGSWSVGLAIY